MKVISPLLGTLALVLAVATPPLAPTAARAEVIASAASGFRVMTTATIAAPPSEVYEALVNIGAWWNSEHSWSSDSRNMSLEARPGGCFCEKLPDGGGVVHGTVIYAAPGSLLRLNAVLGPLQRLAVTGILTWKLDPAGTGTAATVAYTVGGYAEDGLQTLAEPVDGVIGEQLQRLAAYVETGKPVR